MLLFHRLFPSAKGRCCSQVLRGGATGGGLRGMVPSCRGTQDCGAPRQRRAPLRQGTLPRPLAPGLRVPAEAPGEHLPLRRTSSRPGGLRTAQTPRKSLQRSPAARFTPRLYLMTLNEPFSLPRTWLVGGNYRAGKDEVPPTN